MTGKEAQEILEELKKICIDLLDSNDKSAFFRFGGLVERLENIVETDKSSVKPIVEKEKSIDSSNTVIHSRKPISLDLDIDCRYWIDISTDPWKIYERVKNGWIER